MPERAGAQPPRPVSAAEQGDGAQAQYLAIARRWSAITPPVRPSAEDVGCFERAILESRLGDGASALILGSTPELRSLAHTHRLATTCCDIDKNVYVAVSTLRTAQGEETFIHENWLNLTPPPQYDLIVGDLSLNMLTPQQIEELVPRLAALLSAGGVCVQRVNVVDENLTLDSIGPAIELCRRAAFAPPLLNHLTFLVESLRNDHFPEMTMGQFFEELLYPRLVDGESEHLKPLAVRMKFGFLRPDAMAALLSRHFVVTRTARSEGPGTWQTTRIYTLRKKPL